MIHSNLYSLIKCEMCFEFCVELSYARTDKVIYDGQITRPAVFIGNWVTLIIHMGQLHTFFFIRIKFKRILEAQIPENKRFLMNHAKARFSFSQGKTFLNSKFLRMFTCVMKFFFRWLFFCKNRRQKSLSRMITNLLNENLRIG